MGSRQVCTTRSPSPSSTAVSGAFAAPSVRNGSMSGRSGKYSRTVSACFAVTTSSVCCPSVSSRSATETDNSISGAGACVASITANSVAVTSADSPFA